MNYSKIYDDLIAKAKSENRQKTKETYYEAHHIIPLCMGGTGFTSQWKKHPNIVLLTAREHFIAHKLLVEIYPDNKKLFYGLWMMYCYKNEYQERNYNYSSTEYERNKIIRAKLVSEEKKGMIPWNTGKKLSEEHKKKISLAGIGRPCTTKGKHHSDETKAKISKAGKDRIISDEQKQKISKANKGKKRTEEFCKQMTLLHIGRKHSEETKKKMSETRKGRKCSEESIKRMCIAQKGKFVSEETRKKISESLKIMNAKKKASKE